MVKNNKCKACTIRYTHCFSAMTLAPHSQKSGTYENSQEAFRGVLRAWMGMDEK